MFHISVGLGIKKKMRDSIDQSVGKQEGRLPAQLSLELPGIWAEAAEIHGRKSAHPHWLCETANLSTRKPPKHDNKQWNILLTCSIDKLYTTSNGGSSFMVQLATCAVNTQIEKWQYLLSFLSVSFFLIISINHRINRWIVYDYTTSKWWIAELMRQNGSGRATNMWSL